LNMIVFKWILGFFAALLTTFCLLGLFEVLASAVNLHGVSWSYYLIYHSFAMILSYFLFVFLACYFVPVQKKYAGILAVLITFSLIVLGLIMEFAGNVYKPDLDLKFIINIISPLIGLQAGFYISYKRFKNKSWGAPKASLVESEEY
jgi:hypothetical protein